MTLIQAHKNRKLIRDLTILDADGDTISPGTNDVVRVKIGRRGQAPILDLDSAANSDNGSKVTKNTPSAGVNRLEITRADMDLFQPTIYTLELSFVDNADSQEIKHVDHQVFAVQKTMTGDVGTT